MKCEEAKLQLVEELAEKVLEILTQAHKLTPHKACRLRKDNGARMETDRNLF